MEHTWLGSLVEHGAGAAGLMYRRNRYYDPQSGRFTQQDPIGIAGGVNLYGFAGGDPVNYSDPFGLCPDKNDPKCTTGAQIRANIDATIDHVIDGIGEFGHRLRQAMPGLARDAAVELAFAAVPYVGEVRAGRRVVAVAKAGGRFLSENRHIRGVNAARKDFSRIGATTDEVVDAISRGSGWEAVAEEAMAGGQVRVGTGTVRYTLRNLGKETVFNAWIP